MSIATASRSSTPAPASTLSRKLAAVAGAAGVVATGAGEAEAVPYTPTAGVVAAQGIPGFSFVDATNVTLGSLRPPATAFTQAGWDVDGSGGSDFSLGNFNGSVAQLFAFFTTGRPNYGSFRGVVSQISNLGTGDAVSQPNAWAGGVFTMTSDGDNYQANFTLNTPGQFGFRFKDGTDTYYGWGSLVIDGTPATQGQGFQITEAYYNSAAGAAIDVGAVPVAVPEPSGMALLGLGAAGIAAWRARRKAKSKAGAEPTV